MFSILLKLWGEAKGSNAGIGEFSSAIGYRLHAYTTTASNIETCQRLYKALNCDILFRLGLVYVYVSYSLTPSTNRRRGRKVEANCPLPSAAARHTRERRKEKHEHDRVAA
jgi:hypothetical protein